MPVLVFWCFGVLVFRFQVYRGIGFRVNDIVEGQKGGQVGAPKKAKIQHGVKHGHLFLTESRRRGCG